MVGASESVNVFPVDGQYLFAGYFEERLFDRLRPYYNPDRYRFEVPEAEFAALRTDLETAGYDVSLVEATGKFTVAVEMYTAHPENVFEESVAQREHEGYNCFLMSDQYALARAVAEGGTRLTDSELSNPF